MDLTKLAKGSRVGLLTYAYCHGVSAVGVTAVSVIHVDEAFITVQHVDQTFQVVRPGQLATLLEVWA